MPTDGDDMEFCAERADDDLLNELRTRVSSDPKATLTRWEALQLLLHLEHQDDRIEALAYQRDLLRDEQDQIRNTRAC